MAAFVPTSDSRFLDGFSAEETLVLLQLAWGFGSPAIAAHCGSWILQIPADSVVSPADVNIHAWRLAAYHVRLLAACHLGIQTALGKELVPLHCLTGTDVKVLLEAEQILCKHSNDRQHVSAVVHYASDAGTVLPTASSENQNSHLQHNLREYISAAAHQALGASTVQETLEWNNQFQLQDKHSHSMTLAGFKLQPISRMPRLKPKPCAAITNQNSQLQRDDKHHVSALVQARRASTVQETLERNNWAQLQDSSIHSLTLTGFGLYTTARMPRLCSKRTPATSGKQNSHSSANLIGSSQDVSTSEVCMRAPVQAGLWHGSSVHKCVCHD